MIIVKSPKYLEKKQNGTNSKSAPAAGDTDYKPAPAAGDRRHGLQIRGRGAGKQSVTDYKSAPTRNIKQQTTKIILQLTPQQFLQLSHLVPEARGFDKIEF